jgi:hypothetical protein
VPAGSVRWVGVVPGPAAGVGVVLDVDVGWCDAGVVGACRVDAGFVSDVVRCTGSDVGMPATGAVGPVPWKAPPEAFCVRVGVLLGVGPGWCGAGAVAAVRSTDGGAEFEASPDRCTGGAAPTDRCTEAPVGTPTAGVVGGVTEGPVDGPEPVPVPVPGLVETPAEGLVGRVPDGPLPEGPMGAPTPVRCTSIGGVADELPCPTGVLPDVG